MKVPFVPVIVTVNVPAGALRLVLIVIMELPPEEVAVTGFGEKLTDVLGGFPLALSETLVLAPVLLAVTVSDPKLPRVIVMLGTEGDRLKFGVGAVTVTLTVVECGPAPLEIPVMVSVYVPGATDVVAVTLRVVVAVPFAAGVSEPESSEQVAFVGHPPIDRPTALLNPLMEVTEMVESCCGPP